MVNAFKKAGYNAIKGSLLFASVAIYPLIIAFEWTLGKGEIGAFCAIFIGLIIAIIEFTLIHKKDAVASQENNSDGLQQTSQQNIAEKRRVSAQRFARHGVYIDISTWNILHIFLYKPQQIRSFGNILGIVGADNDGYDGIFCRSDV